MSALHECRAELRWGVDSRWLVRFYGFTTEKRTQPKEGSDG